MLLFSYFFVYLFIYACLYLFTYFYTYLFYVLTLEGMDHKWIQQQNKDIVTKETVPY